MKRVLLLVSFVALALAGVASASRDARACCAAGAVGQAHAQHEMHGRDAECCAKMAEGRGCCTPDGEGKKGCCAEGPCEMKKKQANGEPKAGCCDKKADGEARAGCGAKKARAEGKAGCCTRHAPQGSRS